MSDLKLPIGVLGGTFDPVHFGHLRMAIELKQALQLAQVKLIPCFQPVHRKNPTATPMQRVEMLKIAVHDEPDLVIDLCEIERKGPSYTIDTLEHLKARFPQSPLCMFMGIDALLSFTSWHQWEKILSIAHLIIAYRPFYQLPNTGLIADILKERLIQDVGLLHQQLAGLILLHPITSLDISATDIRRQISQGLNTRFLLPDPVYQYIKTHGIYSINHQY